MFASLGAYGHLYPMMPLALAPTMIEQCERVRPDLVIYEAMNTERIGQPLAASGSWPSRRCCRWST